MLVKWIFASAARRRVTLLFKAGSWRVLLVKLERRGKYQLKVILIVLYNLVLSINLSLRRYVPVSVSLTLSVAGTLSLTLSLSLSLSLSL